MRFCSWVGIATRSVLQEILLINFFLNKNLNASYADDEHKYQLRSDSSTAAECPFLNSVVGACAVRLIKSVCRVCSVSLLGRNRQKKKKNKKKNPLLSSLSVSLSCCSAVLVSSQEVLDQPFSALRNSVRSLRRLLAAQHRTIYLEVLSGACTAPRKKTL